MKPLRKTLADWRRQREALTYAKAYHEESRARKAELTADGRSQEGVRETFSLLGIDAEKPERPRMVTIGGVRP